MTQRLRVFVAGAGVFGLTAALELRTRGHEVTVCDPGPVPHPLAASTDVSKVVRMDYGPDDEYFALMETALEGWRRWNQDWPRALYHETGLVYFTRADMAPGEFEFESLARLQARGYRAERLRASEIAGRFPAWNTNRYTDGYFNADGGWAESGAVITQLAALCRSAGVYLRAGRAIARVDERGGRVTGVHLDDGAFERADRVVIAAGAWTPHTLPDLAVAFRSVGQPVWHLRPARPERFAPEVFPVWGADISRTGYYGFALNSQGVVKLARHGVGREMHPESPLRVVSDEETAHMREFLRETFAELADAPAVYTRVCMYTDTHDGHFWIAEDPERAGLVVATGGSGHAFKFAPVLGELSANAVERVPDARLAKFRWRPEVRPARGEEAARYQG